MVLLAWIFVLGVLAGRGVFSDGIQGFMERNFPMAVKQKGDKTTKTPPDQKVTKEPHQGLEFRFHEELSKKTKGDPKAVATKPNDSKAAVKPKSSTGPEVSRKGYTVQLASLASEFKALKMANRLLNRGYKAYVSKTRIKGKSYFRVRCGTFKTRKEADQLQKRLAEREKIKGFVIQAEK
jgi:cell division septation protein DedD